MNPRLPNCASRSGSRRWIWSGSKKRSESVEARRVQVEWADWKLSVRRQCELLGLNLATAYYMPANETEENLWLMRRIDDALPEEAIICEPADSGLAVAASMRLRGDCRTFGEQFLRGGAGGGVVAKATGNLQHGSGSSVHESGFTGQ